MRLTHIRINNFQSFGATTDVSFEDLTFLLGPNGSGKTATLQALCRLFSITRRYRDVRASDFHVTTDNITRTKLFVEATFEFPECSENEGSPATVPDHYEHMLLESGDGLPRVRFRLDAKLVDGEVEDETLSFVTECDELDQPVELTKVPAHQRHRVQVHYIPAHRDPSDQVSFGQATPLGRLLRSADWEQQKTQVTELAGQINDVLLTSNKSVEEVGEVFKDEWGKLHKGQYFRSPTLSLPGTDLDSIFRQLSLSFSPAHGQPSVDFTKLSDGQQSLLYLTLILSLQRLGQRVMQNESTTFDASKLRPPAFSIVVMEEPENSLSPYYLGRIVRSLQDRSGAEAQAVIATHSPSMLRRVAPSKVRYLRLNEQRETSVRSIVLPQDDADAHKYVREAVEAFPEIYFARLVVLGEGDSEEIVLPRLLQASSVGTDEAAVVVAPLGGRHVNHFWRLLAGLDIPFVTLLDLDQSRHQGGWGRIRNTLTRLAALDSSLGIDEDFIQSQPHWTDAESPVTSEKGQKALTWLASQGVFFSSPLDLDFSMMMAFGDSYGVEPDDDAADNDLVVAVLGKAHRNADQYDDEAKKLFSEYHRLFKLGSKPTAHLTALGSLSDTQLRDGMPTSIASLIQRVAQLLAELPE